MPSRGKEIISFMDLNHENPAEALPQACSTQSSPGQNKSNDHSKEVINEIPTLHRLAKKVLSLDPYHQFEFELPAEEDTTIGDCIKIVCISDTLGHTIPIPDGDVLIHAGNLTQHGTFVEVQSMLNWLNTLPHQHKIVVAGNHDMVLDQVYCNTLKDNGYAGQTAEDLEWGDVIYLQDAKRVIDVWVKSPSASTSSSQIRKENSIASSDPSSPLAMKQSQNQLSSYQHRRFTVFGTPWTASPNFTGIRFYAHSAFQTDPAHLVWSKIHDNRIPSDTNILIAHGPPRFHGDSAGNLGSTSLLREVHRVKPWLVVSGHCQGNAPLCRGKAEIVVLDKTRISYERILEEQPLGIKGWARLAGMTCRVVVKVSRLKGERFVRRVLAKKRKVLKLKNLTTFVNASARLEEKLENGKGWKPTVFFMKPEFEIEY